MTPLLLAHWRRTRGRGSRDCAGAQDGHRRADRCAAPTCCWPRSRPRSATERASWLWLSLFFVILTSASSTSCRPASACSRGSRRRGSGDHGRAWFLAVFAAACWRARSARCGASLPAELFFVLIGSIAATSGLLLLFFDRSVRRLRSGVTHQGVTLMTSGYSRIAFGLVALLVSAIGLAEEPAPPASAPTPEPAEHRAASLTAADLSAYLDGMLPPAMAIGDIAGAVVAVVKDDRLLFAKGYGFRDVEKRAPVSAEDTLFRPGSISKLFTWTAVMQGSSKPAG